MTPDNRSDVAMARVTHYSGIMRTTLFTMLGIAAIIEFGPGGYSAPLATLVVAVTLYGILAGGVALDDINNLRQDLDEDTANTAYGRGLMARNIPLLKMISTVLLALIGAAELYTIFV